jgi:hypothetical protein
MTDQNLEGDKGIANESTTQYKGELTPEQKKLIEAQKIEEINLSSVKVRLGKIHEHAQILTVGLRDLSAMKFVNINEGAVSQFFSATVDLEKEIGNYRESAKTEDIGVVVDRMSKAFSEMTFNRMSGPVNTDERQLDARGKINQSLIKFKKEVDELYAGLKGNMEDNPLTLKVRNLSTQSNLFRDANWRIYGRLKDYLRL